MRYKAAVTPETNENRKNFLFSDDVQKILVCGKTKALSVIAELNSELNAKGFLTQKGRVSKKYFYERYYG